MITPSRTHSGYLHNLGMQFPKHDSDFDYENHTITAYRTDGDWIKTNLPAWGNFDRVIRMGSAGNVTYVVGIIGGNQYEIKCKFKQ